MGDVIWLGPDREVYTVSVVEEPWDEGQDTATVIFRCGRTGWVGATELDAGDDPLGIGPADFVLLLKKARAAG